MNDYFAEQIEELQKLPYIIIKYDGKYYKCYEIKEMNLEKVE